MLVWCNFSFFSCYGVFSFLFFFLDFLSLLFWSSSLQAVLTQHERPESRVVELQMHFTSREPQSPKLVPTQVAAQVGRPGIWAAARVDSKATAVRVKACMLLIVVYCSKWLVGSVFRKIRCWIWVCILLLQSVSQPDGSRRGQTGGESKVFTCTKRCTIDCCARSGA
jgi:hypothetical protein